MPAITDRLTVATCIACGARNRAGACPDGCDDVALDLVEAAEIDALTARRDLLAVRVAALREVTAEIADTDPPAPDLRDRARKALGAPVPPVIALAEVVEAWGCPACGRIDAPQPCLGVCVRLPVLMADAGEYHALATQLSGLETQERALAAVVRLVAYVTPRAGQEQRSWDVLRARAAAALGRG